MPRKPKLWKWVAGSHGSKVKVFERVPGGPLYIGVPLPTGGYRRESLGHTDREQAMKAATELAARRRLGGEGSRGPVTVAEMFALYLNHSDSRHVPKHTAYLRRTAEMWTRFLGGAFQVKQFGAAEWDAFIRLRVSGEIDARGNRVTDPSKREPIRLRQVAQDMKMLRSACYRASCEKIPGGDFLLPTDPTRGLTFPVERNPRRPIYDADRVDAVLAIAPQIQMRVGIGREARWVPSPLPTLVRLAADTGRRIGSILALRASDWRPDLGTYGRIRWRAESDKRKKEWTAPVTAEVREEMERYRREHMIVGEALFFPAPNKTAQPIAAKIVTQWLHRAEKLAGLEPMPGGAWHPFRRAWATSRKHMSPKDTAAVGGWSDVSTLMKCYTGVDEDTMEQVVQQPKRLRRLG